jgi:hypothetical protein
VQTIQIDKLGTAIFDATTLVRPGITPGVSITKDATQSQILITIAAGIAAGRFDLREIANVAPTNSLALVSMSIGGDFGGDFTAGDFFIIGPDSPANNGTEGTIVLGAIDPKGVLVGDPRWFPEQHLLGISTAVADTGPYRVILLVEERPTLPIEAGFVAA